MPDIGGYYIIHVDLKKKRLGDFLNILEDDRCNDGHGKEIGGLYEIDLKDREPCDIAVIVPEDLHMYNDEDIVKCEILMDEEHAKIGKDDKKRVKKLVTALTREGISVNGHRKIETHKHIRHFAFAGGRD